MLRQYCFWLAQSSFLSFLGLSVYDNLFTFTGSNWRPAYFRYYFHASFALSCLLSPNNCVRSLAHLTAQDTNSQVGFTSFLLRLRLMTNFCAKFAACLLTNMVMLTVMCWPSFASPEPL